MVTYSEIGMRVLKRIKKAKKVVTPRNCGKNNEKADFFSFFFFSLCFLLKMNQNLNYHHRDQVKVNTRGTTGMLLAPNKGIGS